MDVFPTNGTLSRDVLIDMIKSQLADEFQDEDTRQDIFLCLAVSIPATQQVVLRKALVPLLARAQTRGFSRDVSPEDDPHVLLSNDLQTHINNLDISTQLERRIGIASTLIVMGCQFLFRIYAILFFSSSYLHFPTFLAISLDLLPIVGQHLQRLRSSYIRRPERLQYRHRKKPSSCQYLVH